MIPQGGNTMIFSEIIDRFVEQSAVSVMFRGTLENAVTPELLDEVFAETAKRPGRLRHTG